MNRKASMALRSGLLAHVPIEPPVPGLASARRVGVHSLAIAICRGTAAVAALLVPGVVFSQSRTVAGTVLDSARQPIPWVNIAVSGNRRIVADDSGRFHVNARPNERVLLSFTRIGFQPLTGVIVPPGDTAITVVMAAIAQKIAGKVITANTPAVRNLIDQGFYDRLQDVQNGINYGYFITPEDIEKRNALRMTNMLEGYGLIFERRSQYNGQLTDTRMVDVLGPTHCYMTIYLDGIRVAGQVAAAHGMETEPVDMLVDVRSVAGVEIYPLPGAVPPKYQLLNGNCGVILIWTK